MTDDLTTRLTGALDALTAREPAAPPAEELAAIHRDVHRRRTLRTAQHASVAAVTVLAVGAAGWFGLHRTPVEPVETPTPSPTSTPTPTPTTTPTPTSAPTAVPTPVVVAGMPPLLALDDAVLASVGPGWSITLYTNGYGDPWGPDGELRPTALVLTAPSGELYLAAEPPGGAWLVPARWDGPSSVVVRDDEADVRAVLDLRTGAVTPDERGLPTDAWYVGQDAGGDEVWYASTEEATSWWTVPPTGAAREVARTPADVSVIAPQLGPDGTRVLLTSYGDRAGGRVLDLRTGRLTDASTAPDGQECTAAGWTDATHVLLVCADAGTGSDGWTRAVGLRLVRVDVTGTQDPVAVREPVAGEPLPTRVYVTDDGRVVAEVAPTGSGSLCATDLAELRPDGSTLPLVRDRALAGPVAIGGLVDGFVALAEEIGCEGDGAPSALLVLDLATGTSTVTPAGPEVSERRYPVWSTTLPRS